MVLGMGMGTLLLILAALIAIGTVPGWPHSRDWGYGPVSVVGLVMVVLVALLAMGRI